MPNNGNGNEQIVDKRSIIKGDVFPAMPGTGVFNFLIPAFGGAYLVKNLPPDPPPYSPNNKYRDTLLSITPSIEGMWASAVNIAVIMTEPENDDMTRDLKPIFPARRPLVVAEMHPACVNKNKNA